MVVVACKAGWKAFSPKIFHLRYNFTLRRTGRIMRNSTEVLYLTVVVDNSDEAMSLTEYLNQHGFFAQQSDTNEITCPMEDPATAAVIHGLRTSWRFFWEHSDSGLFGLPVSTGQLPIYVKDA